MRAVAASLRRSEAVFRNEVRIARQAWWAYVIQVVMPLVVVSFLDPTYHYVLQAFPGHHGAAGAELGVPDMAVMFSFFLVGLVGFSFLKEHGFGTWNRLVLCARPSEIMAGKVALLVLMALLQQVVFFAAGITILGLHVRGDPFALLPVALALSFFLVMAGIFFVSILGSITKVNVVQTVGTMLLGGISGALTPLQLLPAWVRHVSPLFPTYWALRAYRTVILYGGSYRSTLLDIVVILSVSIPLGVFAAFRIRQGRDTGSWW